MNDHLEDVVDNVCEEKFGIAQLYNSLKSNSEEELYPRCTNFTQLLTTFKLVSLKARNGWTNKSFTKFLELVKEMLTKNNMLPICNYETKKILCLMGLKGQKIHACLNDCVLYKNEFASLTVCPRCYLSRFKKKINENTGEEDKDGLLVKVVW